MMAFLAGVGKVRVIYTLSYTNLSYKNSICFCWSDA